MTKMMINDGENGQSERTLAEQPSVSGNTQQKIPEVILEPSLFPSVSNISNTTRPNRVGTIALVANPIHIAKDIILPYQITTGIIFDRASDEEIELFKHTLQNLLDSRSMAGVSENHEKIRIIERFDNGGSKLSFAPLPKEEWRYYVVRTDDNGTKNIDLTMAALVTEKFLDIGTISLHSSGHRWSHFGLMSNYGLMSSHQETLTISGHDLDELRSTYEIKLRIAGSVSNDGPYPEINRAFNMMNALRTLPKSSSFHVIGLFAILEMLITHNPELSDRGDSITRQLKSKIPLLSNRFDRSLPYQEYFGNTSPDSVWSKLYSYRSAYAHGGIADFTRGPLAALRNESNANEFLFLVVQSIIRNSMSPLCQDSCRVI